MAAGKISIQANDGKVAGVVFEDGASSNVTVTIPKEGGTLATQTGLDTAMSTINASVPAAYHIYNGQLSLSNTVTTAGFSTTLYIGKGTTQSVATGIDMDTQWGNDASEKFGGLVWFKSRSAATNNFLFDTIRGALNEINSNTTEAQASLADSLTAFNDTGYSVGPAAGINISAATYASWNFQTTHRVSGTTNHGKAFTCHYNPFTGFTIVKYEGSGIVGHEIPHYLGRKLGFIARKSLTEAMNWEAGYDSANGNLRLNLTNVQGTAEYSFTDTVVNASVGANDWNTSGVPYILYGWANSYFDEKSTLIGNYEIGVYQGTGVAGNKVTTRGKPAWVLAKRLDSADNWYILDNMRSSGDAYLTANQSASETTGTDMVDFVSDGFIVKNTGAGTNASGGQYLYMVVYDNDSGSGKSKYPKATDTSTLNLNAHVPFANGIDVTGNKVSIAYKNETITLSNSLVQGKNYIALLNDGTYVAKSIKPSYGLTNPAIGDFFSLDTQKWYSNLGTPITPRNYLDCIVYADQNGQPTYVEQIEKVQYFDAVKANDFRGKNACTAWVNFDGTTTPPTIRDSYNVSSVIRTSAGVYDIYFTTPMDNANYCIGGISGGPLTGGDHPQEIDGTRTVSMVTIANPAPTTNRNNLVMQVLFFGGKK